MPKSGGGGIVVPILISLLATVGIAVGGFGIGTGIGWVMYGPIVASVQDSGQDSSQGSETQMDNNRAHTMGSSLGPNVYEENGVIVWQSEYWGSRSDGSNVTGRKPASTPVNPEPDQIQYTVNDPGQITTAKPVQDQAVQPAQTQEPAQSSTQTPGNGADAAVKANQPTVNILPTNPSTKNQQTDKASSGGNGRISENFAAGKVLITTASDNNKDPVYHTKYCNSAKKIAQNDMYWFDSEQAAIDDGRRLCGNCAK